MKDFIQVDEYLARKLKENCDEFYKYLMIEIDKIEGHKQLFWNDVNGFYRAALEKVQSGFKKDCDILKKSKNSCENVSEIVSSICDRGLEKIYTLTMHKLILMHNKWWKYRGLISRHTLIDWLSGNEL